MQRLLPCLAALVVGCATLAPAQSTAFRWSARRQHPFAGGLLVHDSARGVTVMLEPTRDGTGTTFATWELLGDRWCERRDAPLPQVFESSVSWTWLVTHPVIATFDPATSQVMLFGYDQQSVGKTYLYDGASWTLAASGGPSPRVNAAIGADHANGRTLLFGGRSIASGSTLADTWSWDGTSWSPSSGSSAAGARSSSHLAFNPVTGRVAMFGGFDANLSFTGLGNVFEWTGASWQSVLATPPLSAQPFVVSSAVGGAGCYALLPGSGLTPPGLYRWDGAAWTTELASGVTVKSTFVAVSADALVWIDGPAQWRLRTRTYQPSTGQARTLQTAGAPVGIGWSFTTDASQDALIFRTGTSSSGPSEFWRLDLDGRFTHLLTAIQDTNNPNLMAFHPPSGDVVLVNPYTGNTSAFTGQSVVSGGVLPNAPVRPYLVGYHPPSGSVAALTKDAGNQLQVWGFASQAWTLLATGPVIADLPIGAFDGARNRLVFTDRSGTVHGEWDGSTFSTIPPPPGTSYGYSMTPHPEGGVAWAQSSSTPQGWQWDSFRRWDGTAWTTSTIVDPVRIANGHEAPLHYDVARRRWTMFHGQTYDLESAALTSNELAPLPGSTLTYSFDRPASANLPWLVALSTSLSPAIPWRPAPWYGTEVIPLENDWLLGASLGLGMFGVLDANGQGQVQLTLPNVPLVGFRAHAAAVTIAPGLSLEFVSAPVTFTVRN